jgi:hypothetical protein
MGRRANSAEEAKKKPAAAAPESQALDEAVEVPEPTAGSNLAEPVTPAGKSTNRVADNLQSEEKKKKHKSDDTKAKGHAKTLMNNWAESKSMEVRDRGKMLLKEYSTYSGEMQASFARKVLESKSTKDFSWTRDFKEQISKSDTETGGCQEDYYTRVEILGFKGMSLKDFSSHEEALKVADEIIADQRKTYDFTDVLKANPDKHSEVNPLANQYWFAKSLGKTNTWTTARNRTLTMNTNLNAKHMQQAIGERGDCRRLLEDVLGEDTTQQVFDSKAVKDEFPKLQEIEKVMEDLEPSYLHFRMFNVKAHAEITKVCSRKPWLRTSEFSLRAGPLAQARHSFSNLRTFTLLLSRSIYVYVIYI